MTCIADAFLVVAVAVSSPPGSEITLLNPPEFGFFSKMLDYQGIPIKAHQVVDDRALLEARRRLARFLDHAPDLTYNLVQAGAELHIIGKDQQTSDLPYLRHQKGKPYQSYGKQFDSIDARTRGIGGVQASCGEENLLKLPSDRFREHRDICSHEFAHTVFGFGLSPDIRKMVEQQYAASMKKGLWKTAYAATNANEFFAELTMWYVGSRGDFGKIDPKPKEGQEWLRHYDPQAFRLLDDLYAGRVKVQRITYTELAAHPASEKGVLRSTSSAQPTTIVFNNRTSKVYRLFWLDTHGQRKPYGELHPAEKRGQHTFATHPWVIVNADDTVLGIYVAEATPGKVEIRL